MIRRYTHIADGSSCMKEGDSGLYVLLDDYMEELAALKKEIRGLQWLVTQLNENNGYESCLGLATDE